MYVLVLWWWGGVVVWLKQVFYAMLWLQWKLRAEYTQHRQSRVPTFLISMIFFITSEFLKVARYIIVKWKISHISLLKKERVRFLPAVPEAPDFTTLLTGATVTTCSSSLSANSFQGKVVSKLLTEVDSDYISRWRPTSTTPRRSSRRSWRK